MSFAGTYTPPTRTATLDATLPLVTASLAGVYTGPIDGTLAAVLPTPTADLSGTYAPPTFTGGLAATLSMFTVVLAGQYFGEEVGTLDAILPALTVSLSGTYASPLASGTGTLDAVPPNLTISFEGTYALKIPFIGAGVLDVNVESIAVTPEFQITIVDDVLQRAPTALTMMVSGGQAETSAIFSIDGADILTSDLDSDGNLGVTSIVIADTDVGGTQGAHTLAVRQVIDDGATIVATDDYTVLYDPIPWPDQPGDDAPAVAVPEAVIADVRRFVLQDLLPVEHGGIGSYVLPINPRTITSPHQEYELKSVHTTSHEGQFHIFQAGQIAKEWTLTGYCPTQDMQERILQYRYLNRRLHIIDHHNRAWKCVITDAQFVPRLRQNYNGVLTDWGSDFTVVATVMDQNWVTPS